jgi:hypothetical protein
VKRANEVSAIGAAGLGTGAAGLPLLRTSIQEFSISTSSNFCEAKKERAHRSVDVRLA